MRNFITSPLGLVSLLGLLILIIWRVAATGIPSLGPARTPLTLFVQIAITLIVLIASLYVVLSRKYVSDTEKWAFGTIGLLIGYWLPAAC